MQFSAPYDSDIVLILDGMTCMWASVGRRLYETRIVALCRWCSPPVCLVPCQTTRERVCVCVWQTKVTSATRPTELYTHNGMFVNNLLAHSLVVILRNGIHII